jgi:hypothetical protein
MDDDRASDREVDSHKGRNSRAVSPTLTPQGAREGSPNRHQLPKEDKNAAVLMNINEIWTDGFFVNQPLSADTCEF